MPYLSIGDFKYGMDRRRPQTTGIPGTLWELANALISRGGDITRAKKWVAIQTLPAGTKGLFSLRDQLVVFGAGTTPVGMPFTVQYQQLAPAIASTVPVGTAAMTRLVHARGFDGLIYAIADYNTGERSHYYNGARVTSWDTVAATHATFSSVARILMQKMGGDPFVEVKSYDNVIGVTARTPGVSFTLTTSIDFGGGTPTATVTHLQPNVVEVAEVRATATVTITGGASAPGVNYIADLTIDGTSQLGGHHIDWVLSHDATAAALATAINNYGAGCTASSVGAVVTIRANPGLGAAVNGAAVVFTGNGGVTATTTNVAGGVTHVAAVRQVSIVTIGTGTFDPDDTWAVHLNGFTYITTGRASGMGTFVYVTKKRVYSPTGPTVCYCVLNNPMDWTTTTTPSTDAGQFVPDAAGEGIQDIVAMGTYDDATAIYGQQSSSIYALSADAEENQIVQQLENTGTYAARSVIGYGSTDAFYLDQRGVRSLRTRANSDVAYVDDVGSALDTFVQSIYVGLTGDQRARAQAVIDPIDGRFLQGFGSQIMTLSYFPSAQITAWSYQNPGVEIEDLVRTYRGLYIRSGDTIYKYGGLDDETYPEDNEFITYIVTPFMAAQDPAGLKYLIGFDIDCTNEWLCEVLVDPNDTTKVVQAGILSGCTYHLRRISLPGYTSHIAFRFTCFKAGYASISSLAIHYEKDVAS